MRGDGTGVEERDTAKKEYKKALPWEKEKYWDDFLASAKKNNLWTGNQFTKIRTPTQVLGSQNATPVQTEQMIIAYFLPPEDQTLARRHDIGQQDELT